MRKKNPLCDSGMRHYSMNLHLFFIRITCSETIKVIVTYFWFSVSMNNFHVLWHFPVIKSKLTFEQLFAFVHTNARWEICRNVIWIIFKNLLKFDRNYWNKDSFRCIYHLFLHNPHVQDFHFFICSILRYVQIYKYCSTTIIITTTTKYGNIQNNSWQTIWNHFAMTVVFVTLIFSQIL